MARPPSLLTVEEAAQLLRIGRTKAYAMARQWRQTGGQCGLPVLDLGDVLRVPLAQLEAFTGAEFSDAPAPLDTILGASAPKPDGPTAASDVTQGPGGSAPSHSNKPLRRRRTPKRDQLDLFDPRDPSE